MKEPFVHFLVAGTVLFAGYTWSHRGTSDHVQEGARVVPITANDVTWLKETWARQWRRPPSDAEVGGLVADYLREELLAREARELRLDENDMVVRRRLAQKMTFLLEDTVDAAEPTDEEARRLYEASPERFLTPARISFTQILFSRDRRGDDAAGDAAKALQALTRAAAPGETAEGGDRSLLERDVHDADQQAVASAFGPDFARTVFGLAPGTWHGPIASAYGVHVVWVGDVQPARPRSFAEVRPQVIAQWHREQQSATDEAYFAALLKKYEVVADDSVKPLLGPLVLAKGDPQ
jgi:hypothetical protein